ncbi:RluA family pseudouridine synthase [Sulfurimonas sp. HSL-1716]|uniref:RluA family pseudouridine synthase n=1 Tax=Hydrocurvibacter sulfurireducens TaxID=3131937 RepID=UPI0031F7DB54
MPFIIKKFQLEKKQKAFLFLIREIGCSQSEAQRFIARGRLFYNGDLVTKDKEEISGDIEFITFEPVTKGLKPTFETEEFVLFDKPTGMLIHPQNRYTPYSLIDEVKYQYGMDANITHRIDMETSGLVLCAKNKESERDIKMMFQERDMQKKYLALVYGKFENELICQEPLKVNKDEKSGVLRSIVKVDSAGKSAETFFKPVNYFEELDMTLVECYPHTGRQHQIRVHLFHVKHSIVGDPLYGVDEAVTTKYLDRELKGEERLKYTGASRLLLHADELSFIYKKKKYKIKSNVDFVKECLESVFKNQDKRSQ